MQPVSPDDGSLDVIGAAKPTTVAKCHEVIDALARQVDVLRHRVVEQREELAVLQERLKLDSKNSSEPPSSDDPSCGNRAQRRASLRKRGAQLGHKGSCRAVLDESQVDHLCSTRTPLKSLICLDSQIDRSTTSGAAPGAIQSGVSQ